MSEVFDGTVEVQDGGGNTTILLDGDNAAVTVGDNGQAGSINAYDAAGARTVHISGDSGAIFAGGGLDGNITVKDAAGGARVGLSGFSGGGSGLYIGDGAGNNVIEAFSVGRLSIRQVVGGDNRYLFQVDTGSTATLELGAEERPGEIMVRDDSGVDALRFIGGNAALFVGAEGNEGDVLVFDDEGRKVCHMNGGNASLHIGAEGNEGDILVYDGEGRTVFKFNAELAALKVGAAGNEGDILVYNDVGDATIHLDGATGVMSLVGADCAEDFAVRDAAAVEPGTVLVIDDAGALRESCAAYDRRVAGVVSGAGSYRPGIRLDQQSDVADRKPIALMGKVYCKVDAGPGPVAVGDLLTSAETPGHAMKAADPGRAFGAVIGKALAPLPCGRGLIPILVALQ